MLASNERMLENNDLLKLLGGPARIRTGDRQVSRTRAMSLPLSQFFNLKKT